MKKVYFKKSDRWSLLIIPISLITISITRKVIIYKMFSRLMCNLSGSYAYNKEYYIIMLYFLVLTKTIKNQVSISQHTPGPYPLQLQTTHRGTHYAEHSGNSQPTLISALTVPPEYPLYEEHQDPLVCTCFSSSHTTRVVPVQSAMGHPACTC